MSDMSQPSILSQALKAAEEAGSKLSQELKAAEEAESKRHSTVIGTIKAFHNLAAIAGLDSFKDALDAYEQAYKIACHHGYQGPEHFVTCTSLVWYRSLNNNSDGAREVFIEAQSIARTQTDFDRLGEVVRVMAEKHPQLRAQLPEFKP